MTRHGDSKGVRPNKARRRQHQFERERGLHGRAGRSRWQYLEAMSLKQQQCEAPSLKTHPHWTPLGPFAVPRGQSYGFGAGSQPQVAGRISSIALDPRDPRHLLIGAAAGGVWESHDDGQSWRPLTDNQLTLTVGAVAFHPADSSVLFVGTGEGNSFSEQGAGLLRSKDGGRSWTTYGREQFGKKGFYALAFDPLRPERMFAATTESLCHSVDGGETWAQVRDEQTWDISIDKDSREILVAGADGLFRGKPGAHAKTWKKVDLPQAPSEFSRIAVRHAEDGEVAYVFAAPAPSLQPADGYSDPLLWRRNKFGGDFEPVVATPPLIDISQADYDWYVAVPSDNPDCVYLGAISLFKGIRAPSGIWNWSNLSSRSEGDSIHPDQHALAISPGNPSAIYASNDGGIYQSKDSGGSWKSLNKGLCITEIEYLAQHPVFEAWLMGGTQDNGTLRYEGGEVWWQVAGGDGGECGVDEDAPHICFHAYYDMGLERSLSGDAVDSWDEIGPDVTDGFRSLFYPPMEVSGSVVVQAGTGVYISTDAGSTWIE